MVSVRIWCCEHSYNRWYVYEEEYRTCPENWGRKVCCFDLQTYKLSLSENWFRNLHSVTEVKTVQLTFLEYLWAKWNQKALQVIFLIRGLKPRPLQIRHCSHLSCTFSILSWLSVNVHCGQTLCQDVRGTEDDVESAVCIYIMRAFLFSLTYIVLHKKH